MKLFRDTDSDTRIHSAPKAGAGELTGDELNAVKIDTTAFKFDRGEGDYTKDRHAWLDDITMEEAVREIETLQNK